MLIMLFRVAFVVKLLVSDKNQNEYKRCLNRRFNAVEILFVVYKPHRVVDNSIAEGNA